MDRHAFGRHSRVLLWCLAFIGPLCFAEQPWHFISMPDWHFAEGYLGKDAAEHAAAVDAVVAHLRQAASGEFVMIAGDTQSGHWEGRHFIAGFCPGATPEEAIAKASDACYGPMKATFAKYGYTRLLIAVGDHEIGDNDWAPGSLKARMVPVFRREFARHWNRDAKGDWLYDTPIGGVPARPVGTPYEATSYAYRRRNLLVVTVDVFETGKPDQRLHPRTGAVVARIEGDHLHWLDRLLTAARQEPGIRHIIVQGHTPILAPVRGYRSSMMVMPGGEQSALWQTMVKHHVDLYIAGEVHTNTVSKTADSDLVQVVHRGNTGSEYMVVTVEDNRLLLDLRSRGETIDSSIGRLVIDKSNPAPAISGDGELAFLERDGLLLHFPFDKATTAKDGARVHPNTGLLGPHYGLFGKAAVESGGVLEKCLQLTGKTAVTAQYMGPGRGAQPRTLSAWVKTTSAATQFVVGAGFVSSYPASVFALMLTDGKPALMVGKDRQLTAQGPQLNDGQWHHVAVVLPDGDGTLGSTRLYADGRLLKEHTASPKLVVDTLPPFRIAVGGPSGQWGKARLLGASWFDGAIDDVAVWLRPLSDGVIRAIHAAAQDEDVTYNAGQVEALCRLADAGAGETTVGGRTWRVARDVPAGPVGLAHTSAGIVVRLGDGLPTLVSGR